jgi:outer membrane protein TolC
VCATADLGRGADTNGAPGWLTQPLSLDEAVQVALNQNRDVVKAQLNLQAAHGEAMQMRAVFMPRLRGSSSYGHTEAAERSPAGQFGDNDYTPRKDNWEGTIRVVQTIYEGGKLRSAWRAAKWTGEQAWMEYRVTVADVVRNVRTTYYAVLLAEQQITVRAAAVKLLEKELDTIKLRHAAGAVPKFDVLRGEVEVANSRPKVIRARNNWRVAKNDLATLLGWTVPSHILEDVPLTLSTAMEAGAVDLDLPGALARAVERRAEIGVVRARNGLFEESVVSARAGYKPTLGVFAGYGAHASQFREDFFRSVSGPQAGVQLTWDLFDGRKTRGKVIESEAQLARGRVELENVIRRIEQEVRTAWSKLVEAREVLETQKKVQEQAEEAIRLASSRYDAGAGTQLDVLDAQTALTEARTTQVEAVHDYLVARAQFERAVGVEFRLEAKDSGATPPPQR